MIATEVGKRPPRGIPVLLLGLILLGAVAPLFLDVSLQPLGVRFARGILLGHDPAFDVLRTAQADRCLRSGQLLLRWAPDFAQGYGTPFFLFYAPGTYYLAAGLHLLGFDLATAVKLTFMLGILLAGGFAFLLGRDLWGNGGGYLLAALYTYAPYHLADVYVRASLPESFAFVWPPLILWGAWRYLEGRRRLHWLAMAGGFAGLVLTHNLAALMLAPLLGLYLLVLVLSPRAAGCRQALLLTVVSSAGVTAFFWLPMIRELRHLPLEEEFAHNPVHHYANHFAAPWQLFSRAWSFEVTAPQAPGGLSLQVGWVHLALWMIALILLPLLVRRRAPGLRLVVLSLAVAPASIFMMLPISTPLWAVLPPLQLLLFPWRWLLPAAFAVSVAGAALVQIPAARRARWLVPLTVLVVVAASLPYCRARYFDPFPTASIDRALFLGLPHPLATTTHQMEYLPRGVKRLPVEPALNVFATPSGCRLDHLRLGSDCHEFIADCAGPATVRARLYYFPGWTIRIDGARLEPPVDPDEGTIGIPLPAGVHRVEVSFEDTPIRRVGDLTSLATLVGTAAALGWRRRASSFRSGLR